MGLESYSYCPTLIMKIQKLEESSTERRRGDLSSPADGRRSALGLSCSMPAARCGRRNSPKHLQTPFFRTKRNMGRIR